MTKAPPVPDEPEERSQEDFDAEFALIDHPFKDGGALLTDADHAATLDSGWDVKFLEGTEGSLTLVCVLDSDGVSTFTDHSWRLRDHACQESVDFFSLFAEQMGEEMARAAYGACSPFDDDNDEEDED